ncbi:EamA family transporter [Alicyclobacillus sp. ALC3]|uniref:EamA family transporter n=1 Tax=Alicyclobacillus sp. ALC3 TaxID=2796143 RepID=UPI002379F436|nr:DMT family transporter [Alicyclobacillus sp. ALC3]WDL95349.1 DMT family transporter [Alicyclobacillus sp. ALC3]
MRSYPLSVLMMLIAGGSYGVTATLIDLSYRGGFPQSTLMPAMYGCAVLITVVIYLVRRKREPLPSRRDLWLLAGTGAASAVASFSYFYALRLMPASVMIVLLFQFTWMVMLIDAIISRKVPSPSQWLGMAVIVAGTFLSVGRLGPHGTQGTSGAHGLHMTVVGIGVGLLAAICYAIALVLPQHVQNNSSPALRTATSTIVSAAVITVAFPHYGATLHSIVHGLWLWALVIALVGQVIPTLLMLIAIPVIGGRLAGVLGAIELPVTVLVAFLVLGEHVSALSWLGVALILVGIVASEGVGVGRYLRERRRGRRTARPHSGGQNHGELNHSELNGCSQGGRSHGERSQGGQQPDTATDVAE